MENAGIGNGSGESRCEPVIFETDREAELGGLEMERF
jgi:hypothetical protein